MMELTILFLILGSALTLNPTPIQQFLVIPESDSLMTKLWHIGDDIIGFYGLTQNKYVDSSPPEGYLKISPKTSEVKRILDDTVAACHKDVSLLDRSYYSARESTLLYYCVSNNSLLMIEAKDYTVQGAIPVNASQIFDEVIIGQDEESQVYILGLPNLLNVPAAAASELILVNLTSRTVENHVIFNKGSDSQLLVTGYASDSGVSYVLTKGLIEGKTLIEISKMKLKKNDYELTPLTNFTYEKEDIEHVTHNPLDIIDGYLFTNDQENLLIFENNGSLFLKQRDLAYIRWKKRFFSSETLWAPVTASRIGSSKFYAYFWSEKGFSYSLQDGVMDSNIIASDIVEMKIALGDEIEQDLVVALDVDIFEIRNISADTPIYTSFRNYYELMVSNSYYFARGFQLLYVFDRRTSGKLLQRLIMPPFSYYDIATNQILGLYEVDEGCQITYRDLETLAYSNGPLIKNKDICSESLIHINITDREDPFFLVRNQDKYLFVSPATYGAVSWTFDDGMWATGLVIPGEDRMSFSVVYAATNEITKQIQVASYKLNKVLKKFVLQDSFNLTTIQATRESFALYPLINNKVLMAYQERNMAILDLKQRNAVLYDVPAFYDSFDGVRVFYDKNKTPYLTLSESLQFGRATTLPQLFDFTSVKVMPGAIADLTRSAIVSSLCSYYALDEFQHNIGVVRFYDTCSNDSIQTKTKAKAKVKKIEI